MEKIRTKVIMLPTNAELGYAPIYRSEDKLHLNPKCTPDIVWKDCPYYHLYIINDEKIKEGDWVIETSNGNALEQFADYSLNQKSMGCKKVIATTDSELSKVPLSITDDDEAFDYAMNKRMPQPSQAFIEEYCRKGGIDEVDVEYEEQLTSHNDEGSKYHTIKTGYTYLKVNSDNTINTHTINRDTMTREAFIKKWLGNKNFQYCEEHKELMREDLDSVTAQDQSLEVNHGYFVHWHHDLYGGLTYNGVFESREKAEEYASTQKDYDEIHVLFIPYVQLEGKIFALWDGSSCDQSLL